MTLGVEKAQGGENILKQRFTVTASGTSPKSVDGYEFQHSKGKNIIN